MSPESIHRTAETVRAPPVDVSADRLKFNGDNTFQRELRRRVEEHFKRTGHQQRDSARMYLKSAIILAIFVASYVLLVFFAQTWWQGLLLSAVLGAALA